MEKKKILIIDDDSSVRRYLEVFLSNDYTVLTACDGQKGKETAITAKPDIILLDVGLPNLNGFEVCADLKNNIVTRTIPIFFVTGTKPEVESRIEGIQIGADDYITKPFDGNELKVRINRMLSRKEEYIEANPLTGLPGSVSFDREVNKRISENVPLSIFYIDIDNFKAFNDYYGYRKGDDIIRFVARLISEAVNSIGSKDDFVGHIGGDDFLVLTEPVRASKLCSCITQEFDRQIRSYYDPADIERKFITVPDRRNYIRNFPVMTLSIASVSREVMKLTSYCEIIGLLTKLKHEVKRIPDRNSSIFVCSEKTTIL